MAKWKQSFDALRGGGRLLVAPILQTLILNRAPLETINWADKIASWNFQRIVPCHFDCPIVASPRQFREAFSFLEKGYFGFEDDFELLREIDVSLNRLRIVPPPKEKV